MAKTILMTGAILGLIQMSLATFTQYVDMCPTAGNAVVHDVKINDCRRFPCKLKKGTTSSIEVTFKSNVASPTLSTTIHGIIGGVPVPWSVPGGAEACSTGRMTPAHPECLKTGETYKYQLELPIHLTYPSMRLRIKVWLKDAADNNLVCMMFVAIISS